MMEIRPLTKTIGAEVHGIDLGQPLDAATQARLRQAWLEHLVLVVPQQAMSAEQHIAFTRIFGTLDDDSAVTAFSHPDHRAIFVLTNETKDGKPSDTRDVGWQWHTDLTYAVRPSAGAVLHAQEIPENGGDTMFASMYAAHDALSPAYRAMLEPLEAVHDIAWRYASKGQVGRQDFVSRAPPVLQPMVRTHPETGRRALLIGEAVLRNIHGMTEAESATILSFLAAHATQDAFVYRHRWRKGDVLIWDNRCTMHRVVADHNSVVEPGAPRQVRRMHRTTLKGHVTGRLLDDQPLPVAANA